MRFLNNMNLLMDVAGDGQGGGGSLLTGNTGGSASNSSQGGTGNGDSAAAAAASAGNGNAGGGAAGNASQDWRTSLPTELRDDPSLKVFNDVGALAKSYIHAQKTVGAEKIVIPGKHATDEDWKGVYEKLGLPKDIKEYAVKIDETASLDKAFVEKFKETAHKAGILPAQAQKLADWFAETNKLSETEVAKVRQQKVEADLKALQTEWGAAYPKKLQAAGTVIRELGDADLVKYLDESGLGNDTKLIKLLASVQEKFMKEDTAIGGEGSLNQALAPKDALNAANKIMSDFSHPYHNKDHANHKAAVDEVRDLFAMAYPGKQKSS